MGGILQRIMRRRMKKKGILAAYIWTNHAPKNGEGSTAPSKQYLV